MIQKQKICAGWDENSHPAFIWKNIKGKKYCKECSYKVEDKKTSINKVSDRQKEKIEEKKEDTEKQFKLFLEIWDERKKAGRNYCEVSGKQLPQEALSIYFDHLLEKSKYPQFRYEKRNIVIIDGKIHTLKTNGFPLPKHKELIEKAKKELL